DCYAPYQQQLHDPDDERVSAVPHQDVATAWPPALALATAYSPSHPPHPHRETDHFHLPHLLWRLSVGSLPDNAQSHSLVASMKAVPSPLATQALKPGYSQRSPAHSAHAKVTPDAPAAALTQAE